MFSNLFHLCSSIWERNSVTSLHNRWVSRLRNLVDWKFNNITNTNPLQWSWLKFCMALYVLILPDCLNPPPHPPRQRLTSHYLRGIDLVEIISWFVCFVCNLKVVSCLRVRHVIGVAVRVPVNRLMNDDYKGEQNFWYFYVLGSDLEE